ncbi:nicotinate phosphoribosyltransferase [Vibrio sp. D431a]|uniref:nicotinate phosphoribosyltransferase n=1 Tax=Vibrio sp. D431a TaxID=2837388 RepID=UPI00255292E3|nr:nicotinate phosphoribosyltransferase [Vibrio sp. D431a]MDK9790171.1 nicotinate phosphoribosyltransferase [Vibrio sp. D431a]
MNTPTKRIAKTAFNKVFRDTVIQSFADIDAYKLHMAAVAWEKFPSTIVEYKFVNRTKEDLTPHIAEIKDEIMKLERLSFTDSEIRFFHTKVPFLKAAFVDQLRTLRLFPDQQVRVFIDDKGRLQIRAKGSWFQVIWYEIFVLAIISEVRNRRMFPNLPHMKFREVLMNKISKLKSSLAEKGLENDFKFMEFGTRRRASYHLQNDAIMMLNRELPNSFIGTSNYHMAIEQNVPYHGTVAHEYFQAFQVLSPLPTHLKTSLEVWDEVFEGNLGIALTDSITTDAFLKEFNYGLANRFAGLRHDSGCPFEWGEKCIEHYKSLGIDPNTKKLVFTDGLNFDKAIEILEHFQGRAQIVFGIGTFLSNDLDGYEENGIKYSPLSMVMKLVQVNGNPVAKISDEPVKSICECPFHLANLMTRFGLSVDMNKVFDMVENS